MSEFTEFRHSYPVTVTSKDHASGEAIGILDYGKEDHVLWLVIMDADGSAWWAPNPEIRFHENWSLGRKFAKPVVKK